MNSLKTLRALFWILLLSIGFLAGWSWKTQSTPADDTMANEPAAGKETQKAVPAFTNHSFPEGLNDSELATIRLFERAAPSVCFIITSVLQRDFWTLNESEIQSGSGSGFVWDDEGHIVTNYHVIKGADFAQVTLADRSVWQAKLIGVAPEKDLAVLRIEAPSAKLTPLPSGSSENLRVGQSVFAIGNPFGLDQTLTTGIVSAIGREIEGVSGVPIRDVIQTDAAINPGNSGGPLLDSSGKLIGVNTAIYSPSGASAGIGFSIPVNVVRWVVPEIIRYGKVRWPDMGINFVSQRITARLGIHGLLVSEVQAGGPAAKVGIKPTYRNRNGEIILGDIITGINGEPVDSQDDVFLALEKFQPGDLIVVNLLRNEKETKVNLTLGESD